VEDDGDRAVLLFGGLKAAFKAPGWAGEDDFWHGPDDLVPVALDECPVPRPMRGEALEKPMKSFDSAASAAVLRRTAAVISRS
jgi:hypothetical protein